MQPDISRYVRAGQPSDIHARPTSVTLSHPVMISRCNRGHPSPRALDWGGKRSGDQCRDSGRDSHAKGRMLFKLGLKKHQCTQRLEAKLNPSPLNILVTENTQFEARIFKLPTIPCNHTSVGRQPQTLRSE